MKDILEWSKTFDLHQKPWLLLGKGPSFSRISEVDLDRHFTCSLNHVVTKLPVTLAHVIDIDVVAGCKDAIYRNAKHLALPFRPHVGHKPTDKTIHDFVREMDVLQALEREGRLVWFNLSSSPSEGASPPIKAKFFSAESAVNILAACGAKTVRSLGVDGGNRYSERFDDLVEKTLLANGHTSFDKQFLGIAETIRRTGLSYGPLFAQVPVRVFVGTDAVQRLAVKVLEYSIKKHAAISCEVVPIDDAGIPEPRDPRNRTRTGFSFSRFRIPELTGYRGRGIYLDADMQVFADIGRLWTCPMEGASALYSEQATAKGRVPQYSVLLLDCERLSWDVRKIVTGLDEGRYTYEDLMHRMCLLPPELKKSLLPFEWNSLEHYEAGRTCLVHYTDMNTQPWVTRKNKNGKLWYDSLKQAVDEGFVSLDQLHEEIRKGHMAPSLCAWAGLPSPPGLAELEKRWSPPYLRLTKPAAPAPAPAPALPSAPPAAAAASDVDRLRAELASKENQVLRLEHALAEKERFLDSLTSGTAWKLIRVLWGVRRILAPAGSLRERVGKVVLRGFKKVAGRKAPAPVVAPPAPPLRARAGAPLARSKEYERWIQENEPASAEPGPADGPLLSLLTWAAKSPAEALERTLESLRSQSYSRWEWCLVADGEPREKIAALARSEPRVRVLPASAGAAAAGLNAALKACGGDYAGLLDPDDALPPFALLEFARFLKSQPDLDAAYSDVDEISRDGRFRDRPVFRPGFSPATLLTADYFARGTFIRAALLRRLGGWREGAGEAHVWDLHLRLSEATSRVGRLPKVLYHVREGGRASRPSASESEARGVQEHLDRTGRPGTTERDASGRLRVRWSSKESPKVSILIPTRDKAELLEGCVNGLLRNTDYPNFEVLLAENGSREKATFECYERLTRDPRVRVVTYGERFNYSRVNNWAARFSTAPLLLFLNNDTEVRHPDWLREMVGWAVQKRVGVVGVKLVEADGVVQHAGVYVGHSGVAGHLFRGIPHPEPADALDGLGLFGGVDWYRELQAVTAACLMMRREVFDEVGGFDERFLLAFSDTELCLKARAKGYAVIYTPFAVLTHRESSSRPPTIPVTDYRCAVDAFGPVIREGDPSFSPNLSPWHATPRFRTRDERSPDTHVQGILSKKIAAPSVQWEKLDETFR